MPPSPRPSLRPLAATVAALTALAATATPTASAPVVGAAPATAPLVPAPRLVLFLLVDQARADYLARFRPLLRHGLDRLLRESVWFTAAYHEHAVTKTAPGTATLISGAHPRRHGIIGNEWVEPGADSAVDAVEDEDETIEHSPRRLLVSTLGDWLKAADPRARVFAVSAKDRSAILLGGHRADGAFWFDDETGTMVSSPYYPGPGLDALGGARRFGADPWFGRLWTALDPAVLGPGFGLRPLDRGALSEQLPHELGNGSPWPEESFWVDFDQSPFVDELTAELAAALLAAHQLGRGEAIDLLAISFSALDEVGHDFGPDSPELADTLVRLDRVLGRLLAAVDAAVGLDRTLIALSADHGVNPVPGVLRAAGAPVRMLHGADVACQQALGERLAQRHGAAGRLRPGPFLDPAALAAHAVTREAIERSAQQLLAECPAVVRVWTRSELAGAAPPGEPEGTLFYNAFHPARSPDVLLQLAPHYLPRGRAATNHGSPYDYDRHVPWLLRLPEGRGAMVAAPVATVDVAPTLAALLGLEAGATLDGRARLDLLPPPAAAGAR